MTTKETTARLSRRAMLAAVSLIGLSGPVRAQVAVPALVDLAVIDRETGQQARVWRHAGRLYVAGRPGARYSLRVTNNTGARVLAVMSVDGVNILTGETAGYDQRGYVFEPHQSYAINGWRKSDDEVAAFTFTAQDRSYAARTGRPADVGVIGVAAFRERFQPPSPVRPAVTAPERRSAPVGRAAAREDAPALPAMAPPPVVAQSRSRVQAESAAPAAPDRSMAHLGTGHGAREWSSVSTVPFVRATLHPQFVYRVEYDSRERLMASGIIPRPRPTPAGPRPFPAQGYVPDPPRGG